MAINFILNGKKVKSTRDPLTRLIDILRDDWGLTGTKEGCSEGECGACSVLLDGKLVTSCIIPLGACQDSEVLTIDGIKRTKLGKVIISAYADGGAVQCGFCIPGMVVSSYYLLMNNHNPTEKEVRKGISGNLCRCTGYDLIVKSIMLAAERARREGIWE